MYLNTPSALNFICIFLKKSKYKTAYEASYN